MLRVRACRDHLIGRALADPNFVGVEADALRLRYSILWMDLVEKEKRGLFPDWGFAFINLEPLQGPEKLATILSDLVRHVKGLERYESRALARRKSEIRDLDAARRDDREQHECTHEAPLAPASH